MSLSRQSLLAELESLYQHAIEKENLTLALRIKELEGRLHGFFKQRNITQPVSKWSTEELQTWIDNFEEAIKQISPST